MANQDNFNNAFQSRTAAQDVENKTIDGTSATGSNDVTTDADKVTIESNGNYYNADDDLDTAVSGVDTQVKTNKDNIDLNDTDISNIQSDITAKFNTTTGHDHDGTDSKKVVATAGLDTTGGTLDQVLVADGSGGSSWADQSGGGGGTGVNFLTSKTISDYSSYNDGAVDTPVDGTGGTASYVTVSEETVSPISTSDSDLNVKISKTANNAQGEGISVDFTTRGEVDFASPSVVKVSVKASTNFSSEDFGIWLYSKDNTTLISTAQRDVQASTLVSPQIFEFQTDSSADDYRLIFHCRTTNALAYDLTLTVEVGPKEIISGPVISDLESWTPTGSWTTNTSYSGLKKIVGDEIEYNVRVDLAGAPNNTALSINLPETIDTSKIAGFTDDFEILGIANIRDSGVAIYRATVNYLSTTSVQVGVHNAAGTYVALSGLNASVPHTWASGDHVDLIFKVPVLGQSSNQAVSTNTGSRAVVFEGYQSANETGVSPNSSTVIISLDTASKDSVNGHDPINDKYIIQESGDYKINGLVWLNGINVLAGRYAAALFKNGTSIKFGDTIYPSAGGAVGASAYKTIYLERDDEIQLGLFSNQNHSVNTLTTVAGTSYTSLSVTKIQSPQQLLASEKVYGFANTDGTANGNFTTAVSTQIIYDNIVSDSHGLMNTSSGIIEACKSGSLSLSANLFWADTSNWSSAQTSILFLYVGGVLVKRVLREMEVTPSGSVFINNELSIDGYPINKGDLIEVKAYQNTGSDLALYSSSSPVTIGWEIK